MYSATNNRVTLSMSLGDPPSIDGMIDGYSMHLSVLDVVEF